MMRLLGWGAVVLGVAVQARAADGVTVRVRLAEAVPQARIKGFDLKIHGDRKLAAKSDRSSDWQIHCEHGRIRVIEIGGARRLELAEPATFTSATGFLSYDGRSYRESLRIHSVGSFCTVINDVDLERYLDGLVNSEFNSKWNKEALSAQIIAARTYALYQVKRAAKDPASIFDVDSTTKDQVYDGVIKEDRRAHLAVERSRGQVLTLGELSDPLPLKAFYHSSCGGVTELPQNVWGTPQAGFKRAIRCGHCDRAPKFNWSTEVSTDELVSALQQGAGARISGGEGPLPGWPSRWREILRSGTLLDVGESVAIGVDRIDNVLTKWKLGRKNHELWIPGQKFREWLGATRIRSTVFKVAAASTVGRRPATASWRIEGRGYGHGVGLCQWGAKTMGEKGYAALDILKHYYPDAVVRRLW